VKRALPLIVVLVITFLAAGLAGGVNAAIGVLVAPDAEALAALDGSDDPQASQADETVVNRPALAPRVKTERQYLDAIMGRNLFNPDAIADWNPSKATSSGGPDDTITDLKITLLGTVVATPASYSSALIAEDGDDGPAKGYSIGHHIHDAEVIAIEPKVVTLKRGNGKTEYLTMDKKTSAPKPPAGSPDAEGGVEQLSENKYAIDRAMLDKYIGDIEGISRMGRALLHRGADGEFDGYRLSAIRRNTLADQLGIKNGDVVHSVNGSPLTSVQNAMSAYQTMMNEDSFTFEVTRRGQKVTLEYEIR
jgi:type II secretion system protein C